MIRIFLGKLGSGKTAYSVREIIKDRSDRKTYTNVVTKGVSNIVRVHPQDMIKKIPKEKKFDYDLNIDYWNRQKKPLNILWDEVHLSANSRRSQSKVNMVWSKFYAMARRITGFDQRGYGSFTFVAQKERTIDVNLRELASEIYYFKSHWIQRCEECSSRLLVNSEMRNIKTCPVCASWKIIKTDINIEVFKFDDWEKYYAWCLNLKGRYYFQRELITDIYQYFDRYDTLQIDNVWNNYVTD